MWRDDPSDGNVYDVAPAQAQPKANKKKKRQSKKKEPNAPKRAMSAYIFFTFAIREQTKRENPDISVSPRLRSAVVQSDSLFLILTHI